MLVPSSKDEGFEKKVPSFRRGTTSRKETTEIWPNISIPEALNYQFINDLRFLIVFRPFKRLKLDFALTYRRRALEKQWVLGRGTTAREGKRSARVPCGSLWR